MNDRAAFAKLAQHALHETISLALHKHDIESFDMDFQVRSHRTIDAW